MEDGVTQPCPRAAAQMAAFDGLPAEYRRFLSNYERGLKADAAAMLLRACGGDVEEAIHEIRVALPVRRHA
jgi:hypothetical protein